MKYKYPSVNEIIYANKRALELSKGTKAERHKLRVSRQEVQKSIDRARKTRGNVSTKAAVLLSDINRRHHFDSANKRTSTIVASKFMSDNSGKFKLKKRTKKNVRFLKDVREGRKNIKQISRWLDEPRKPR